MNTVRKARSAVLTASRAVIEDSSTANIRELRIALTVHDAVLAEKNAERKAAQENG